MKILIVESSSANRQVIGRFVERFGARPLAADDGESALATFCGERPDLVLLDGALPDIDGFTVARRMRALEKPGDWTPIIFLAADSGDRDIERGIAAGGDDFLHKPVSEIVLGAKMRAMQRLTQMRASMVALTRQLDTKNRELLQLSTRDALTGLANRRHFDETLAHEWRRARRQGNSVALLMCDVDHFKRYNDRYGHCAGDDCLRRVAALLARRAGRASDLAARYGGEEFAIILPETGADGARSVAEGLGNDLRKAAIAHADAPQGMLTLSIGIATAIPDSSIRHEALVEAADNALYRAKHNGRNCIGVAEDTPLACIEKEPAS